MRLAYLLSADIDSRRLTIFLRVGNGVENASSINVSSINSSSINGKGNSAAPSTLKWKF